MDHEAKRTRRDAARRLVEEMGVDGLDDAALREGRVPGQETVDALYDEWLPADLWACVAQTAPACGGPSNCRDRCTAEYWRAHCRDVGSNMGRLARELGEDEELWRFTGLVHDLDYLRGMHHDPSAPSDRAHPLGIARRMHELGAPPVAVLAVLEHSPHLGMEPSSRLSHALVACDEHATMTAEGQPTTYPDDIPKRILSCVEDSPATVDGFTRGNMQERATAGFRALA